ncbi:hypothetical protein [Roseomonas gilardii]|uniref:hypothetical protein n=1 Tax=Roseomonas gilardii TaxID=257708 RepID=UPI000489BA61|nr:hypothetical protein [Roseomonas gilardii]SUE63066.1 Uncharacterised protein [Roseomonas gilardii subsp. rosea]
MSQQTKPKPKPAAEPAAPPEGLEDTIAYLAKRHRVSPAIVREIARRSGQTERGALEREIERGKSRR